MHDHVEPPWWRSTQGIALLGFLGVAGFFLISEHWAHLYGALPYLLVLACPLMHLFHRHGGHGGHAPHRGDGEDDEAKRGTP
jgi:DUF2933 family protein